MEAVLKCAVSHTFRIHDLTHPPVHSSTIMRVLEFAIASFAWIILAHATNQVSASDVVGADVGKYIPPHHGRRIVTHKPPRSQRSV
jgi:hypothetical protein